MTKQVEDGLADMRRIRAEMHSLSAKTAVPYLMADKSPNVLSKSEATDSPETAVKSVSPAVEEQDFDQPLPIMPPVGSRMYSPSHTDKIETIGGADLLIETIQQSQVARSWKDQQNVQNKD